MFFRIIFDQVFRVKNPNNIEAMTKAEEAQKAAEQAKREGMQQAAEQLEGIVAVLSSASEQLSACLMPLTLMRVWPRYARPWTPVPCLTIRP